MRKLKLQMQMTIDGFVAGPNNENDWVFIPGPQDPAALQFTIDMAASSDIILAGSKMVNGWAAHWQNVADNQPDSPWNPFAKLMVDTRKIVFSRNAETEVTGSNIELETGDLATVVNELKSQPGKDILVYGGVDFVRSLVKENLIDEYYLVVNPVAIGTGLSIFSERMVMRLEDSVAYTNGKVLNKYVPV